MINKKPNIQNGFSLIELLIVITIIGIFTANILPLFSLAKDKAYLARQLKEFDSIHQSVMLYLDDYMYYPEDTNRDMPPGLESYLAPGVWPEGAWPGSVYDWDNWIDPDTGKSIYQISVRFCPLGGSIDTCNFPKASWADDFDQQSSVYYCIKGACRAHIGKNINHPGYCVNCHDN